MRWRILPEESQANALARSTSRTFADSVLLLTSWKLTAATRCCACGNEIGWGTRYALFQPKGREASFAHWICDLNMQDKIISETKSS